MNWIIAVPEIALGVLGIAILMFGVLARRHAALFCNMFVLGALLIAALLTIIMPGGTGYHGLFVVDTFSRFVDLLMLCGAALSLILSFDYNRQEGITQFEFPVLILFAVVGMMVMISAANLMTLYLGLELQLIALYVVTAFHRGSIRSSEAALKYFILGALASGLLLYGISLVYGFTGSM
ncbi:MAG: proton-conducting transporter membrane subunit, partial [Gammaproteobacteria bacterium]